MPSSSATRPRQRAEARNPRAAVKGSRGGSQALWPLLICIVLDPFTVHFASVLALEGPKPFTLLYPWVEFLLLPVLHLSGDLVSVLTQWMLYLQFPLYGLLMTLTYRVDKRLRTLIYGLIAHFGGFLLVVSLAYL
jgi:hypothetical protein